MFKNVLSEFAIEKKLGGYSRYCEIWGALCEKGLRFVCSTASNNTIVFGMDHKQIWSIELPTEAFMSKASDLTKTGEQFAQSVFDLLIKKNPKIALANGLLPTRELVESKASYRVLFALACGILDYSNDRLLDACFEMGDGSHVNAALQSINEETAINKICQCKLSKIKPFISKTAKPSRCNDTVDMFAYSPA